jgi:molybdopterin converting factor small subunit
VTTIRFFAGARAAVGVPSVSSDAATLGAALDGIPSVADPARWDTLRERCSYLVDGVATRDRATSLAGVEQVDVMPPFAGG